MSTQRTAARLALIRLRAAQLAAALRDGRPRAAPRRLTMEDTFYLTTAVLAVAALVGLLANRARQPLIVAYIVVGVVVGPSVLGWVDEAEPLELFAEIGIAILLFLVGLKLDLHLVRTTGRVAVVTGLGQVVFTSVVGFGLALLLGMNSVTALYVAVALTFSSTIIIVKLLSDKRELEELHGRIALGFLIVQDIVVKGPTFLGMCSSSLTHKEAASNP